MYTFLCSLHNHVKLHFTITQFVKIKCYQNNPHFLETICITSIKSTFIKYQFGTQICMKHYLGEQKHR